MIEIKSKLRRWGNSFGIVVPQSALKEDTRIRENEEVVVMIIKNKPNLRKFFGAHKFKKPVEQMMREIDKELYNE
ncbi:hypothetical protein HYV88_00415 [Candidatus Woesearchaeota archaeon]|nr:hypothetical protein [Candidatus Woesearchaeota archaeon]